MEEKVFTAKTIPVITHDRADVIHDHIDFFDYVTFNSDGELLFIKRFKYLGLPVVWSWMWGENHTMVWVGKDILELPYGIAVRELKLFSGNWGYAQALAPDGHRKMPDSLLYPDDFTSAARWLFQNAINGREHDDYPSRYNYSNFVSKSKADVPPFAAQIEKEGI